MTAERFLTDKIDKKMFQVIRKQMNDLSLQDCLYLRMLLRHISTMPNELYRDADQDVPNEQRHHIAAAALTHDNLCASNILVDEQYNIKGSVSPYTPSRTKNQSYTTQTHKLVRHKTPPHPLRPQTPPSPLHPTKPIRSLNHTLRRPPRTNHLPQPTPHLVPNLLRPLPPHRNPRPSPVLRPRSFNAPLHGHRRPRLETLASNRGAEHEVPQVDARQWVYAFPDCAV